MSRLHRNSTCGTGTHSAGKLTKTEVDGKEDSWLWEREEDKPPFISFSQISVLLLADNYSIYLHPIKTRVFG